AAEKKGPRAPSARAANTPALYAGWGTPPPPPRTPRRQNPPPPQPPPPQAPPPQAPQQAPPRANPPDPRPGVDALAARVRTALQRQPPRKPGGMLGGAPQAPLAPAEPKGPTEPRGPGAAKTAR